MTEKRLIDRPDASRPFMDATVRARGLEAHGRVVDLAARGAGVLFDRAKALPFEKGDEVDITFDCLIMLRPIDTVVRVNQVSDDGDVILCGFEFLDLPGLTRQVPFVLRRDFNRRHAARVEPDRDVVVRVQPLHHRRRVEGRLIDLSIGGLALEMPPADGAQVATWKHLRLTFRLSADTDEFTLVAVVRSVRNSDLACVVSVQFDAQHTMHYDRQQASIALFVLDRWRQSQGVVPQ